MNEPGRAMATSFAAALVVLTLVDPAFTQPGATKPSGAQTSDVGSQAAQPAKSPLWLQNLQSWLKVIAEHKPGEPDIPAMLMGSATEAELEAVRIDLFALLNIHRRLVELGTRAEPIRYKNADFTASDIQKLLGLTSAEAERSDATRILERGAILHGDVAMLVVPTMPGLGSCSTQSVIIVKDGHEIGTSCRGIHWVQSRALLDAIRPDPRKDPLVLRWYLATIAYLLQRTDYSSGVPHIDHGSLLFPDDPGLLFEHGYYHEAFASRYLRAAVDASKTDTRPASTHLKEAEGLFRRALVSNPEFVEARVHHGAVLGALGRHDEAADELRKAAAAAQGPTLRYFAELFLGDEEQALGSNDAARAHYNAALALFPLAQSPWVALSALARRSGDRIASLSAIQHMLNLSPGQQGLREDPWWGYNFWLDQDAVTRLRDLYRPFVTGDQR